MKTMLPRTLKNPGRAVPSFACCAMLMLGVAAKLSSKIAAINTEYFLSFIAIHLSMAAILASSSAHVKQRRIPASRFFKVSEPANDKDDTENAQKQKKVLTRSVVKDQAKILLASSRVKARAYKALPITTPSTPSLSSG